MAQDSIEQALSVLETEKANLSAEQLRRLVELTDTGKDVRSDVTKILAEKRELTPEQADRLIGTLRSRFDLPVNTKLRKAIDFSDVEKSLHADPEALFSIHKLEETGGEPQVVSIEGDEYIFEDRSAESPAGRRNLDFDEAEAQRKIFGQKVRFQSEDAYLRMQEDGKFDLNSQSWLETDPLKRFNPSPEYMNLYTTQREIEVYGRPSGRAKYGYRNEEGVILDEWPAGNNRVKERGWRATLRVKKV